MFPTNETLPSLGVARMFFQETQDAGKGVYRHSTRPGQAFLRALLHVQSALADSRHTRRATFPGSARVRVLIWRRAETNFSKHLPLHSGSTRTREVAMATTAPPARETRALPVMRQSQSGGHWSRFSTPFTRKLVEVRALGEAWASEWVLV